MIEGLVPYHLVAAATTNATVLVAGPGTLGSVVVSSVNAAARYLKFYNKATTPAPATDTPAWVVPIPGNTAGAAFSASIPAGLRFTTGISFAIVTGIADTDNTAVAASEIVISLGYAVGVP